ncbi:DUF3027 domain-containing protein [Nocardia sp. NPDC056064]|uniref:DUF3027 domain-containing protein n=1 Tax=Nocardia sp. NPDC056064 TaxID=3345701 RepID=UPI0035D5D27D
MYAVSAVSVSESGVRPVLADAAEVARRALVELEPHGVGVHLGVTAEDETAATHRFEASLPGYRGWQWAVVVAAPPGAESATVSESALLPGPDALIAPDFIPWEQRVRPGDLGPGDLLAPPTDDPRLVPGYVATGDPVVDDIAREVGLGRVQVLSLEGRVDAAQRWYLEYGPDTEMAKAAPSTCGLCGFYVPLAGALRESFGVCANAMGADGHVVHVEYGCGAHSDVVAPSGNGSPRYEAFDDHAVEYVQVRVAVAQSVGEQAPAEPSLTDQETAEAEAVEAAAAEQVALAEGAAPESAAEVVAAESQTADAGDPSPAAGESGQAVTESGQVAGEPDQSGSDQADHVEQSSDARDAVGGDAEVPAVEVEHGSPVAR